MRFAGSLGRAIGVRAASPNCASKNRKRRERRSSGVRSAWGLRFGRSRDSDSECEWLCGCLLEDSVFC